MRKMCEVQRNTENLAYPGFRQLHLQNDTYVGKGIGVIEGGFPLGDIVSRLIVQDDSPEQVAEWGQQHLEQVTGIAKSDEL